MNLRLAALPLFFTSFASAHCPLCTAGVGVGVAAARYLGLDDAIVGLFLGGFVLSTALWAGSSLKKRVPFQNALLVLLSFALTIIPLYFAGLFEGAQLFGVNRLLLGVVLGCLVSYAGLLASKKVKEKRGSVLFPFQTIAFVLLSLVLASAVIFLTVNLVNWIV